MENKIKLHKLYSPRTGGNVSKMSEVYQKHKRCLPFEGVVERAWTEIWNSDINAPNRSDLNILFHEDSNTYILREVSQRVNKGDRLRIWPYYSMPESHLSKAIEFLDESNEVQYTVLGDFDLRLNKFFS